MPDECLATVQMDEKGRLTIPTSARKALDCHNTSADVTLRIEVLDRHE